jgi:putative FmdB family regulatory protein
VPLYEYRCACGNRFELLRRMGQDAEGVACPRCGGSEVEKEFSTFAGSVSGGTTGAGTAAAGCSPSGRFT